MNAITLKEKFKIDLTLILFCFFVFFITFVMVIKECSILDGDYLTHIGFVSKISFTVPLEFFKILNYPMWHFLVAILNKIIGIDLIISAAIISAIFNVATMIILWKIAEIILHNKVSKLVIAFIVSILTFITPIYVHIFNPNLYLGQGSPTVWHNPTSLAVKPFALLIFYLFIVVYNEFDINGKINKRQLLLISTLLAVSCLAKPSFFQGFLPSVMIFLLIELIISKGRIFKFCFASAAMFIPSGFLILTQFIYIYFNPMSTSTTSGIAFSFFDVWRTTTTNIPISILITVAFPLYVLFLDHKNILKNKFMLLSLILVVTSICEYGFIMETGVRKFHGNFGWAYILSLFIFFIFTIIRFVEIYFKDRKEKNIDKSYLYILGWILLTAHFLSGLYYYVFVYLSKYQL